MVGQTPVHHDGQTHGRDTLAARSQSSCLVYVWWWWTSKTLLKTTLVVRDTLASRSHASRYLHVRESRARRRSTRAQLADRTTRRPHHSPPTPSAAASTRAETVVEPKGLRHERAVSCGRCGARTAYACPCTSTWTWTWTLTYSAQLLQHEVRAGAARHDIILTMLGLVRHG